MVLAVLVQKNLVCFLVHLSYWNTPSIENGLLRQPEFLDWQKALFSFLVSLSALIEFSCHRLKPDAKQGCWPPCMCLSLSTFILTGQSGDVRNQRWREREMGRKNKKNQKNEEREQLFCSYNELLIHHEVSAEKRKLSRAHHSSCAGGARQVCFLFLIFFMTDCPFTLLASLILLYYFQVQGRVYFQQQVRKLFPFLVMVAVKMTTGQVYLILVSVHHILNQQCAFSIYNAANYLFFFFTIIIA